MRLGVVVQVCNNSTWRQRQMHGRVKTKTARPSSVTREFGVEMKRLYGCLRENNLKC